MRGRPWGTGRGVRRRPGSDPASRFAPVRHPLRGAPALCHPPPREPAVTGVPGRPGPVCPLPPPPGARPEISSLPPRGVTPRSPSPPHRAPIAMARQIAKVGTGGTGTGPAPARGSRCSHRSGGSRARGAGVPVPGGDRGFWGVLVPVRGYRYRGAGEAVLGGPSTGEKQCWGCQYCGGVPVARKGSAGGCQCLVKGSRCWGEGEAALGDVSAR